MTPKRRTDGRAAVPVRSQIDTAAASDLPTMNDNSRSRRNVVLFWVHVGLAALVLGGFVYAVVHK